MKKRDKSPFLKDKPTGTSPKQTMSLYLKDLFNRSDKAIQNLKKNID